MKMMGIFLQNKPKEYHLPKVAICLKRLLVIVKFCTSSRRKTSSSTGRHWRLSSIAESKLSNVLLRDSVRENSQILKWQQWKTRNILWNLLSLESVPRYRNLKATKHKESWQNGTTYLWVGFGNLQPSFLVLHILPVRRTLYL